MSEVVRKYAHGDVLDMGCGSGIQAFTAAALPNVTSVLGVDRSEEAVQHCRKECKKRSYDCTVAFLQSDLFTGVKGMFDTIIFNPPYLPNDPCVEDVALDGGPEGYELIARFLAQAKKYLKKQGCILLLFSSLTNEERVHTAIKSVGLQEERVAEAAYFFERLYVSVLR